ncbi:hypothetical protein HK096_002635, partial [Nowakowskiella sp. JEL0078]
AKDPEQKLPSSTNPLKLLENDSKLSSSNKSTRSFTSNFNGLFTFLVVFPSCQFQLIKINF